MKSDTHITPDLTDTVDKSVLQAMRIETSPAPWGIVCMLGGGNVPRLFPDGTYTVTSAFQRDRHEVATVHGLGNARLIAAAPDLLAFVRECATDDLDRVSGGMKAKARELLTSATKGRP